MATLYKSTCNSCSEETEISWGDGMFYLQYQCINCLKLFHLPRKAPRKNRNGREVPKFLEKDGYESFPPTQINKVIRFSDEEIHLYLKNQIQWQHGDDEWDAHEVEQLIKLVVSCTCNAAIKRVDQQKKFDFACQKCGSTKLQIENIGVLD